MSDPRAAGEQTSERWPVRSPGAVNLPFAAPAAGDRVAPPRVSTQSVRQPPTHPRPLDGHTETAEPDGGALSEGKALPARSNFGLRNARAADSGKDRCVLTSTPRHPEDRRAPFSPRGTIVVPCREPAGARDLFSSGDGSDPWNARHTSCPRVWMTGSEGETRASYHAGWHREGLRYAPSLLV